MFRCVCRLPLDEEYAFISALIAHLDAEEEQVSFGTKGVQ
jgi:hypothetical protein